MNDEDFENKLIALTDAMQRPDPTPAWKDEILTRAMRETNGVTSKRRLLPPRWLVVTWGTAWAAALVLNLAAPQTEIQQGSSHFTTTSAAKAAPTTETLLAYNRRLNFNIDMP